MYTFVSQPSKQLDTHTHTHAQTARETFPQLMTSYAWTILAANFNPFILHSEAHRDPSGSAELLAQTYCICACWWFTVGLVSRGKLALGSAVLLISLAYQ